MSGKPPGHILARQPWNTGTSSGSDPYTELAVAVVLQAVEDYIKVLKKLLKGNLCADEETDCEIKKQQIERFFRSPDYEFYIAFMNTEIEPETLIYHCCLRAKEQFKEERKNEKEKICKQAEKSREYHNEGGDNDESR